jgi:hypothetical protein
MNPDEDAKLRAIHSAIVGANSANNLLIKSIRDDIQQIRSIVQSQVRRSVNGVSLTKSQKEDNQDTNTFARATLFGSGDYDGLVSLQEELESQGYDIGSPDVIDYDAIGGRVRTELDKTFLNA